VDGPKKEPRTPEPRVRATGAASLAERQLAFGLSPLELGAAHGSNPDHLLEGRLSAEAGSDVKSEHKPTGKFRHKSPQNSLKIPQRD